MTTKASHECNTSANGDKTGHSNARHTKASAIAAAAKARPKTTMGRTGGRPTKPLPQRCRISRLAMALAGALSFAPPVWAQVAADALPQGGVITSGQGAISRQGATMTVTQGSDKMIANWDSFNIGAAAAVRFQQPAASSIALNRVIGGGASAILGRLDANGQVMLINPAGVTFGAGAQVNVGAMVASSLNLSDANFLAGSLLFNNEGAAGAVRNLGDIRTADGGAVALLAPLVANKGKISTPGGSTLLASGDKVSIDFVGDGLISYAIDKGIADSLVSNSGEIKADGGLVVLSGKATATAQRAVVKNTGVIQAQTLDNRDGRIYLMGDMQHGLVEVAGTLDASAPNGGDGGFVETSAAKVRVAEDSHVTTRAASGATGTWLLDPTNITIAAIGGDMTGHFISSSLQNTNFEVRTADTGTDDGDIFVNDEITWSNNKLTLNAHRNIEISKNLNGSGSASLALKYGQGAVAAGNSADYVLKKDARVTLPSGESFSTQLGNDGPQLNYTVMTTATEFIEGMESAESAEPVDGEAYMALGDNLSFASINNMTPISLFQSKPGIFTGLGNKLTGIIINRYAFSGVFSAIKKDALLRDFHVTESEISGNLAVGGLVGATIGDSNIKLQHVSYQGKVQGNNYVGGLIGLGSSSSSIINSYIKNTEFIIAGGFTPLAGFNSADNKPQFINSYYDISTVTVKSTNGEESHMPFSSGIYNKQFSDWYESDHQQLDIDNYFTQSSDGFYLIQDLQNLKDTLAFTKNRDSGLKIRLTNDLDMSGLSDFSIPLFAGGAEFDGAGHVIHNYKYNAATHGRGFISQLGWTGEADSSSIYDLGLQGGTVSGVGTHGGLVGVNQGSINGCYTALDVKSAATAATTAAQVGGLVGINEGSISNSYHMGKVEAPILKNARPGGLAGSNRSELGSITNSYAVSSTTPWFTGTLSINDINNSYMERDVSSDPIGYNWERTAEEMLQSSTFKDNNWDISSIAGDDTIWRIYEGRSRPLLRKFLKPLTLTAEAAFTYNGQPFSSSDATYTASETHDPSKISGVASFAGNAIGAVNAGDYTLTLDGSDLYSTQTGYDLSFADGALTISPRVLAPVWNNPSKAKDKEYDGGVTATIIPGDLNPDTFNDVLLDDKSNLALGIDSAEFDSPDAAGEKTVTVSYRLLGLGEEDSNNYQLLTDSLIAAITPKTITWSRPSTANDKVYNGDTDVSVNLGAINTDDIIVGDNVSFDVLSAAFTTPDAGAAKPVTVNYELTGAASNNYQLLPDSLIAAITPKTITWSKPSTANDKVYNGDTDASVNIGLLDDSDKFGNDEVSAALVSARFANARVEDGKEVYVAYELTGSASGNYKLVRTTDVLTADITPMELAWSTRGAVQNKVYDGATRASATPGSINGADIIEGDEVNAVVDSAEFQDANAGVGKKVTVIYKLTGDDSGNYKLTRTTEALIADITPRQVFIKVEDLSKTQGFGDPEFLYSLMEPDLLLPGDRLTGKLARKPGEDAGRYAITLGDLGAGPNYELVSSGGVLTIESAPPDQIPRQEIAASDLEPLQDVSLDPPENEQEAVDQEGGLGNVIAPLSDLAPTASSIVQIQQLTPEPQVSRMIVRNIPGNGQGGGVIAVLQGTEPGPTANPASAPAQAVIAAPAAVGVAPIGAAAPAAAPAVPAPAAAPAAQAGQIGAAPPAGGESGVDTAPALPGDDAGKGAAQPAQDNLDNLDATPARDSIDEEDVISRRSEVNESNTAPSDS